MVQALLVRPLTDEERRHLTEQMESANKEEARRAELLLMSAEHKTSSQIAARLDLHPSNIKKWIRKFNEAGIPGIEVLKRGPRQGPKPSFNRKQIEELLVLASTDPEALGLDFRKWTAQKLARAAVDRGIAERISHVTVQKILNRNQPQLKANRASVQKNGSALAAQPNTQDEPANLRLGRDALSQYHFNEAVDSLSEALNHDSLTNEQEAEARSMLSQALEELGRDQEAYGAVEKYQDAGVVRLLPDKSRAQVKLRLGWAYSWLRNHPSAIASLNEAKKLYAGVEDKMGVGESLLALGRTYIELRESRIARDHLLEILKLQESVDNRELMAKTYTRLGTVDFYEGCFNSQNEHYLKALELAEHCANPNVLGLVLLNLGISSFYDDPDDRAKAANYTRRAIDCLSDGGHQGHLILAYNNLGDFLRISGDWNEAVNSLDKAIEIAVQFDRPNLEATGRQTKAELLMAMGKYDEAEEHTSRCIELAEKDGDKWIESYSFRILGGIHLGRGRIEEALVALRHALRLSTSDSDLSGIALAEIALAECHCEQGAYEIAGEYIDSAHSRLKEEKSRSLMFSGMLQRLQGQVQAAGAQFLEAKNHLSQSLSVFAKIAMPYELARTHEAMGRVLGEAGDLEAAVFHLAQAHDIFKSLGAIPGIERTRGALTDIHSTQDLVQAPPSRPTGMAAISVPEALAERLEDDLTKPVLLGPQNDVALMQRLIEAAGSRETLLQEFAAVVYECFGVEVVMVCRSSESAGSELIACEGITVPQAERLCQDLNSPRQEDDRHSDGAYVAQIGCGIERPGCLAGPPLLLYIRPACQFSEKRLLPLIKQVEFGLETCSLRASSTAVNAPDLSAASRVVMPGFIVGSPVMSDVIDKIYKIRTSDVTVLITGESGTGKELVARAIHAVSARARAIFLPFNCTATPRDLIDSQLFGHRRGAFTGAVGNYSGMVRAAEGGTLYLDEIGDLALEVQPKLMRFLQESEIQPLGETKPQRVDVRVIAATNSDLERAVEEGRFREDLFHRLNIIRIHVPPLRERREEVPSLASFFLDHFASRSGNGKMTFSQDAIDALVNYDWPGNVRQLRNEIERATAYTGEARLIAAADLSPEVRRSVGKRRREENPGSALNVQPHSNGRSRVSGHLAADLDFEIPHELRNLGSSKLKDVIAHIELRLIRQALSRNNNNLSRTATELGLSRRGLRLKLAQFGIERS